MKQAVQQPVLNSNLQPVNSPIDLAKKKIEGKVPWQFGIKQGIQAKHIRLSKLQIKNIVQLSNQSSASGTFGNGSVLFLTTALTPQAPQANEPNFAVPYIAIFQGTYASTPDNNYQIYPNIGGSITPFSYSVQGGLDLAANSYNGTNSLWSGVIKNSTGTTQSITFVTEWKVLYYNNVESSLQ